jgi:uncharacterized protein (TIGR01777 family)
MKHYLITGGTGLIGAALCQKLLSERHAVTVLSRQPENVHSICGSKATGVKSLEEITSDTKIDAVINLAGAPIVEKHWTKKRKRIIKQSRIDLTARLIDWLSAKEDKPDCLISGSAVGWYGDSGNSVITEQSSYHDEYTHQLCEAWEQTALRAKQLGMRVCIVRTGLVLAAEGGFLSKMLLSFKMGLGAQLGNGEQFMPWIHINDIVNLFEFLAEKQDAEGVFNGCAPIPVNNKTFTQTLAKQLHRPAFLNIPAWFLKILLGEMSRLLLTGQQAIPEKAQVLGFPFEYTDLNSAIADVISTKTHKN